MGPKKAKLWVNPFSEPSGRRRAQEKAAGLFRILCYDFSELLPSKTLSCTRFLPFALRQP